MRLTNRPRSGALTLSESAVMKRCFLAGVLAGLLCGCVSPSPPPPVLTTSTPLPYHRERSVTETVRVAPPPGQ